MSRSSEEVLLVVNNVKNKKTDGTLYMMGERMGWMLESKNVFNISYMYADIKAQKISADTKEKVQLQVILNDSSANTFLFTNPHGREAQMQDREAIKEILQQMLPKFKRKISSELEEKNKALQENPEAYQLYKDLVVSGVLTSEEFWSSRSHLLSSGSKQSVQNVGVSPAFLADVKPETNGANGLKYNLTSDIIHSIFRTYPMVKKKHMECVPHTVSESEFWTRFFQSHYFHRDRFALTAKDIFTECAKNDDDLMRREMSKSVNDPLVDLTILKDTAADDEYRGISEDNRSSNNSANQAMIKHFNQHSTLVLRACNISQAAEETNQTNGTTQGDSGGKKMKLNGEANGDPKSNTQSQSLSSIGNDVGRKRKKIKDKVDIMDLNEDKGKDGVSLRLTNMDRYLHGPTRQSASGSRAPTFRQANCSSEEAVHRVMEQVSHWKKANHSVLIASNAIGALSELSPGGSLMPGTSLQMLHQQVSPAMREEIKQQYGAICELLRHFWTCFPVSNKSLEDKVIKMRMTLERFERNKLAPLKEKVSHYHYALNLTGHLYDMLHAAYNKFDLWQEKKKARRT